MNGAPLCSSLRAGSQRRLTIDFRSPPRPPMSPADGRHPSAPPPRCSCHQAEACCMAQIARAAWRTDGPSALISANRSALGGIPRSGPIDRRGPRPRRSTVREFGARRFISQDSERDYFIAWTCLAGCKIMRLPAIAAGPSGGRGTMGAADSDDNASLRGGALPCTAGSIKDGSRSHLES